MKKTIKTLFVSLLFIGTATHAATRTVCASGGTYTTITAAINASGNGDEIVICPGTYTESLAVSRDNLTFRSSTGIRSDVTITNSDSVFKLNKLSTTIRNLTIISTGNNDAIVNDYNNGVGIHTFDNLKITTKARGIYLRTGGPHMFRQLDITSSGGGGIHTGDNADTGHVFDTVTVNSVGVGITATRGAALMKNITITSNDIGITLSSKYSTLFQTIKVSAKNDGLRITEREGSSPQTFVDIEVSSQSGTAINLQRGIASMTRVKATGGNAGIVLYGASLLKDIDTSAQNIAMEVGSQSDASVNGVVAKSTADKAIFFRDNGGGEYVYNLKNITITGAGGDGLNVQKSARVNAENICVQSAAGNGVQFGYNAKKITLINSILKGHVGHGVSIFSNPESNSHVNNSCFYKAPCAEAEYAPFVRDFSGNFTAPANCNNGANVTFTAPFLSSCPVTESSCYVGTIPETIVPGGFNAFESSTPANAITGVIKTKIAGSPITLDVIALNTAGDAVAANFVGNVGIELVESTANCATSSALSGASVATLAFAAANNGRKTITLPAVADVYRDVRVRISYAATTPPTVACSTDNFAIRPAKFTSISARNTNWETAGTGRLLANMATGSGNVHKAGQPFTLQAMAVNAASATTSNYVGNPVVSHVVCSLPAPPSCVSGELTTSTWSANNGQLSTSEATYSEAGSFTLMLKDEAFASVDNKPGDSLPDEYTISGNSADIGRFVPDHFTLTKGAEPVFRTFNAACTNMRSFTYIGQPFMYATAPTVLIAAKNKAGITTQNYRDNLWNLSGENVTQDVASTAGRDGDLINTPMVTPDTLFPGTGSITIGSIDRFKFLRNLLTPQAPFDADLSLSVTLKEFVPGHGDILSSASLVFNGDDGKGITFDSGNEFRYGRMRLDNAHGSDLLDLAMPIKTEYWNGNNFVLNTDDNCTIIAADNVQLKKRLNGITIDNLPDSHIASGNPVRKGVGSIVLRKPTSTAKGSVDVCVDLGPDTAPSVCSAPSTAGQAWLQGKWSEVNYDDDPAARASFGSYRSGPMIYMREVY